MKKRIAILTQPLGHNYGGIIQNYALQTVLKNLGYEPITIDRRGDKTHSAVSLFLSNLRLNIYKRIFYKNILTRKDYNQIAKNNQRFLVQYIQRSPKIESRAVLEAYFQKQLYIAVVVGSDQTWRPKYSPDIFNFYLDFLQENKTIKKLAYASSFGTEEWEYTVAQTKVCKELIQQFDAISVREDSGVHLCKEKLNVEALYLLDPTLLLIAEDYSQLINKPRENKELFTYILDESTEKQNFIQSIGDKLGLKQSSHQAKKFDPAIRRELDDYIMPPLEGWLQGFRDAEFVITDSFHGTVFSIIHQKPFIAVVNKARGASRFESLLGKLGMEDRMVYDVNDFDENLLSKEVDYKEVFFKLDELKRESLLFLKRNLQ